MIHITIEHIFVHISFLFLILSTLFYWGNLLYKSKNLKGLGKGSLTIALICTTISLIVRWFYSKHLPLSNSYESSIFLSWSLSSINLFLDRRDQNGWIGTIIVPSAVLTHGFATLGLPNEMQQFKMLVPALQSHWLMMHVSMMLLGYATILCGSLLAIILLFITISKTSPDLSVSTHLFIWSYLPGNNCCNYMRLDDCPKNHFYLLSMNLREKDLIQRLDYWSYRIIGLGFPLLTVGILSGAVWANEAWGSYWSWDPKETWAFITWLAYAIYLHTRMTKGWQEKGSAIVASLGFFLVWICYLGVNLLGIGLHSYGWLI
uniref:Cytochrome c biogenesis protein CcsA n=1 Tax=Mankyua chejuensis TaxID=996148 RepID=H8Y661_9MONI|nr:cytochrome c heme attachment protein [Mankyua chejuensis]ADZ48029.1 cytochrome c heme attachment protein [Mankyua chejuensis]AJJ48660.1 cytochrome c biogenesis protein [Mankyua chejuensis]